MNPKRILAALSFGLMLLAACNNAPKVDYDAIIETDYGNMKVLLYDETPMHKENFLKLAKEGFYDGLLFHRVMEGFMIQGGDPMSKNAAPGAQLGMNGPGYTLAPEIGFPHFKGTLSAARKSDQVNPEKRSSGSQFFIVQGNGPTTQLPPHNYSDAQRQRYAEVGGTPQLDMQYTVFGEVVEGLGVIDKIAAVATDANNRPTEDVRMKIVVE